MSLMFLWGGGNLLCEATGKELMPSVSGNWREKYCYGWNHHQVHKILLIKGQRFKVQ